MSTNTIIQHNQSILDNLPVLKANQIWCLKDTITNTWFSIYSTRGLLKHFNENPLHLDTHIIQKKNSSIGNGDNDE